MNNSTSIYENLMKEAINERNKLTSETVISLRRLYEDVADDLLKKASTAKGGFTRAWTSDYEKYMRSKIMELDSALVNLTKDSILTSAEIAASVNGDFLSFINDKYKLDIDKDLINIAYSVNNDVIGRILQGGLYKDNRSLSERIWRYSDNTMSDIQYIIAKGMAEQKSYLEMIKDLEKYVDPTAKKPWNFGTVYPNLKNKQVDFNAQRLLRTSINHSFFTSNMAKAKENPYVEAVHWNLSSVHYERQVKHFGEDICDEYANQDRYKLGTGNFPKDNVPLPHPQCLCYQSMVIPKSLEDIGRELGMWVRGVDNPVLDNWFKINKTNRVKVETKPNKRTKEAVNKEGNVIKFNLDRMKEESRRRVTKTIEELSNKYNTRLIGVTNEAAKKGLKGSVGLDFKMNLSTSKKDTIVHEFAHSLSSTNADKLGITDDKDFWKEIKKVRTQYNKAIAKDERKKISNYSLESIDEFMAEAFTQSYLKNTNELGWEFGSDYEYADKVMKIIDKYFKKK